MIRPKLTDRQVEVLRWIADGCPERSWPDETHKITARALQSRGLAEVSRKRKIWAATITGAGSYYLKHGAYQPKPTFEAERLGAEGPRRQAGPAHAVPDSSPSDATSRAMRRVANRPRPVEVKQTRREIKETYMRYKVVVTRVQVAERLVRATNEEDAAAKVQAEFDRPYGYFGSWKTTSSEVDVIEAEQTTVIGPTHLSHKGPLLLSIKDAAKALGISYSTLYQMMNQGDVEWVAVGSRKFISREHLMEFIKTNTHKGYYVAR
ncbi:helix-turn-helix domain-containing protein [Spongiactinospora sp. TRM90649]|uniref:helix-turn-helix domain-containing protein n=1 Tax=Spongiactinospora sp. TRM90649 TaxID=3031114 RepID=UPI0023F6ACFC|nr:helix-turn-helix domain-containing protein [Spongiactinospora sp. TRM90649]MDF5754606.1 helix-turn-helix domain-containing protein [Spongiactinospora sp. TRM90649]